MIPIQTSSFYFLISRHFLLIKWSTPYRGFEVAVTGCAFSKAAAEPQAALCPGLWAPCCLHLYSGGRFLLCLLRFWPGLPISALFRIPPSSLLVLWTILSISTLQLCSESLFSVVRTQSLHSGAYWVTCHIRILEQSYLAITNSALSCLPSHCA